MADTPIFDELATRWQAAASPAVDRRPVVAPSGLGMAASCPGGARVLSFERGTAGAHRPRRDD